MLQKTKTDILQLQEHEQLSRNGLPVAYNSKYDRLKLIQWDKPLPNTSWGYYASFKIGAEWIDDEEALVVTAKRGMERIDFLGMFMTCFTSGLSLDSFSEIYSIDTDKPPIEAPILSSVVSPLIVVHYINVVNRIKSLKKGYVYNQENLKKVKGHVKLLKNERLNIVTKRYDRIFCEYEEYSIDIPENRLLKKALIFSKRVIDNMHSFHQTYLKMKGVINKALARFENVHDDVDFKSVGQIRSHKLFNEYAEAIRLAKIILKHFDYSINKASCPNNKVTPFVLDMSLLYEHYVYGLLHEAYHDKIIYQFKGETGYPDFLYKAKDFKAILDTKYIPKYEEKSLDTYVVRQLSGYSRDLPILRRLGCENIEEKSPIPSIPCVIIYPEKGHTIYNPFKTKNLHELCTPVQNLSMFYKISIPVPILLDRSKGKV